MIGWSFFKYVPDANGGKSDFEKLFDLFKQLLLLTSGNVSEAFSWLTNLDKQYNITNDGYGVADFIQELNDKGFVEQEAPRNPNMVPSAKMELALRRGALDDLFGTLKKSKTGKHSTKSGGVGDEFTADVRPYEFGDALENIAMTNSIKNAHINHGVDDFKLTNEDLEVYETYHQAQMSTVLMIDISHSMILYGEDRITPAKKVAMALAELITTRYPKDTIDILVFGNDAWVVEIKDLPYLEVGPFHTNTVAGLELAMNILRKRRNPNKQIFMITDGKPSCIKKGTKYYKNSFGLDKTIVNRTLGLATKCRKLDIPITTFMIARDPYLMQFVDQFTAANNGKAFYSGLNGLGDFIFQDYKNNKMRKG
jgi:Ca-activated chloride channel homolog